MFRENFRHSFSEVDRYNSVVLLCQRRPGPTTPFFDRPKTLFPSHDAENSKILSSEVQQWNLQTS